MTEDETRYAKGERVKRSKARHQANVQKLSGPTEEAWEQAMEKFQPPCAVAGVPSKWIDYDSDPMHREPYETDAPTKQEAQELCAECPIRAVEFGGNGLCLAYRRATGQSHGVWGGLRHEDGKWMDGRTRAAGTIGGQR